MTPLTFFKNFKNIYQKNISKTWYIELVVVRLYARCYWCKHLINNPCPRDRGAWWAAIFGVAQSWTWLKRLSSNSSRDDSWGHKRVGHDWTTELNWTQLRDIGTNAQWLLRMDDRSWLCLMAMALGCTGFLSTSCVPEFLLCSWECTSLGIFLLKC